MKTIILFLVIAVSVALAAPKYAGGPYFFKGSIHIPGFPRPDLKQPIEGLEADELKRNPSKKKDAYVVAYYTSSGQLESLEKFFEGKMLWRYVYTYEKEELARIDQFAPDGSFKIFFEQKSKKKA